MFHLFLLAYFKKRNMYMAKEKRAQKERMIKFRFQNTNPYLFSNFLRQMELNRKENKELLISTIMQ